MRKPTVDIAKFATPCGTITFHGLKFRRGISDREVLFSLLRGLSGSAFGGYRTFLGFLLLRLIGCGSQVKAPWMLLLPNSRATSPEFAMQQGSVGLCRTVGCTRPRPPTAPLFVSPGGQRGWVHETEALVLQEQRQQQYQSLSQQEIRFSFLEESFCANCSQGAATH